MKTLYTPVGTKAVLNAQRKSISTSVKKRTRNIIWFNPQFSQTVKTRQNHSSEYWINIFPSLTQYIRFLIETPTKLVIVV